MTGKSDKKNLKVYHKQDKREDEEHVERVEVEEVEIDDDNRQRNFRGDYSRNLHFQTTGCIGLLLGLIVTVVLFFFFLPVAILALIVTTVYFNWKLRKMKR